jgi:hypothetical protein
VVFRRGISLEDPSFDCDAEAGEFNFHCLRTRLASA